MDFIDEIQAMLDTLTEWLKTAWMWALIAGLAIGAPLLFTYRQGRG